MTRQMAPDVLGLLVDHHRRFVRFLEPRVGSRADAQELLQTAVMRPEKAAGR